MTESIGRREHWQKLSPEVRRVMADIAFDGTDSLTTEMTERIQDNAIEDVIIGAEGGTDE